MIVGIFSCCLHPNQEGVVPLICLLYSCFIQCHLTNPGNFSRPGGSRSKYQLFMSAIVSLIQYILYQLFQHIQFSICTKLHPFWMIFIIIFNYLLLLFYLVILKRYRVLLTVTLFIKCSEVHTEYKQLRTAGATLSKTCIFMFSCYSCVLTNWIRIYTRIES